MNWKFVDQISEKLDVTTQWQSLSVGTAGDTRTIQSLCGTIHVHHHQRICGAIAERRMDGVGRSSGQRQRVFGLGKRKRPAEASLIATVNREPDYVASILEINRPYVRPCVVNGIVSRTGSPDSLICAWH